MTLEDCYAKGKIQKGQVDEAKVEGSIRISSEFIQKAEKVMEVEQYDVSMLMSYNSMFHSARALLFRDGMIERSHACLILYLKDKYSDNPELLSNLNTLDLYRATRHNIQYRGSVCTETDATEALKDAKELLGLIKGILGKE